MNKQDITKIIKEELVEALSSKYNTLDKILNALIRGDITKAQAKKHINDINNTGQNDVSDFDCSYGMSTKAKAKKVHIPDFSCGTGRTGLDVRC